MDAGRCDDGSRADDGPIERARREFSVLDRITYLDVAGRAPMADRVHAAVEKHLDECRSYGARKDEWLELVECVRGRVASLIGARSTEIAFMKNTSDGLNTIGAALDLSPGDNILVSPEFEHANNVYPWVHLGARGIDVRAVPVGADGVVHAADVAAAADDRTRLVALSAVSSWTGARPDLAAVSAVCRRHDAFFLVDAAQALGVVGIDVERDGIDGLAAATQKGLLGTYGLGILYCRESLLGRLRPPFLSVSGVRRAGLHESDLGDYRRVDHLPSAARFEVGNPNFAGVVAFGAALSLLEEIGVPAIERHVLGLADDLVAALAAADVAPALGQAVSNIVAFPTDDPADTVARLAKADVQVSLRRGMVRASLHLYNNRSDVDRLVEAL